MKIYNLGSLNIDYVYSVPHFVRPGETLTSSNMEIFPGGKGLNQSIALARAGANVTHGGIVGNDGLFLKQLLSDSLVDVSRIKVLDKSSGHAIIQVEESGQNSILLFAGTNHCITEEYIKDFLYDSQQGDILLLQNEINGLDLIFEIAHKKGMQIAFNPSPFEGKLLELPLEYVDWWFLNEIEGSEFSKRIKPQEIVDELIERYPKSHIILTLGKDGCVYKDAQLQLAQPIVDTSVVDTTAAGDTFTGYFLAMISSGKTIDFALKSATLASSLTVSRMGASSSIPYLSELKQEEV